MPRILKNYAVFQSILAINECFFTKKISSNILYHIIKINSRKIFMFRLLPKNRQKKRIARRLSKEGGIITKVFVIDEQS